MKSPLYRLALSLGGLVALALFVLGPGEADAKRPKGSKGKRAKTEVKTQVSLRLRRVDPALESLPFGGDVDKVVGWARERLEARYGPRMKSALDQRERGRFQQQMEEELEALVSRLVHFDGRRTGYEVSIVQGEFAAGAEESLLLFREGDLEHYFFFTRGVFYKYARPLKAPEGGGTFDDRLSNFTSDQGEAVETVRAGDPMMGPIKEATWQDELHQLRLRDRRLLFRSDVIYVEGRAQLPDLHKNRGEGAKGGNDPAIDPDLEDFLE